MEIRVRPGYSAYNVEEMSGDLSFDELAEAVQSIELLEQSASESQLYFLKKIKRAIKKVISACLGDTVFPRMSGFHRSSGNRVLRGLPKTAHTEGRL